TKNDNSYKKTNLSNAETFYNFKVNTYFKEKRTNEQILTKDIPTLFKEYLEKKANVKNRVNMEIAFMDGKGGGKELFPLYMALATYNKFFKYMKKDGEPKLEIYVLFLSRIIIGVEGVEEKKSIDDIKVTFFPQKKKTTAKKTTAKKTTTPKNASRISIFNTYKEPEKTGKYVIKHVEFNKDDMDNYKENLKLFETLFEEEHNKNLRAFKFILNFNDVKNLLDEKSKIAKVNSPFNYPVKNIDNTYDDIPINEQAGIFIGVNILEDIFRTIEQKKPHTRDSPATAYFLDSGLKNYSLKVIKVRNKESEDERQLSAEWTKSDADYESADIVVEIKSREPKKISGGTPKSRKPKRITIGAWLVNSLAKAEKQVAITLKKRHLQNLQEEETLEEDKNVGFVVSLFNLNNLEGEKEKEEKKKLREPYIYLIIEALIYKEKVEKQKSE
ncbi:MAG: hypothetical protein ACTSRZ_19935, partial [Promethearchaeota archaeon]